MLLMILHIYEGWFKTRVELCFQSGRILCSDLLGLRGGWVGYGNSKHC